MSGKKKPNTRGPKSEHLAIEGDWEQAVDKTLKKKRPKGGWPKKPKKSG